MKGLSLWQPHAQAIALGLKPYETRHWPTRYRGPLAVHAAKRLWNPADSWDQEALRQLGDTPTVYGAVVCIADLVDCIPTAQLIGRLSEIEEFWGNFGPDRFAFRLENIRVLEQPLPYRGMQGFFEVDTLAPFTPKVDVPAPLAQLSLNL